MKKIIAMLVVVLALGIVFRSLSVWGILAIAFVVFIILGRKASNKEE